MSSRRAVGHAKGYAKESPRGLDGSEPRGWSVHQATAPGEQITGVVVRFAAPKMRGCGTNPAGFGPILRPTVLCTVGLFFFAL